MTYSQRLISWLSDSKIMNQASVSLSLMVYSKTEEPSVLAMLHSSHLPTLAQGSQSSRKSEYHDCRSDGHYFLCPVQVSIQ